jgi:AcrR family transcriptional regulator
MERGPSRSWPKRWPASCARPPFDKISIRQLTDVCGIRRQSFYYHFEDVYALLRYLLDLRQQALQAQIGKSAAWEDRMLLLFPLSLRPPERVFFPEGVLCRPLCGPGPSTTGFIRRSSLSPPARPTWKYRAFFVPVLLHRPQRPF